MGVNPRYEWGERLPTLVGERYELRWIEERDAQALFAIYSDPEAVRYWSSPAMTSLEQARTLVRDVHELFATRWLFEWGVYPRDGADLVGTCTLFHVEGSHRRGEIGYSVQRELWGRGVATEAVGVLLRFVFDELGFERVEADSDPDNTASLRVLEKHGFRREGLLRRRWFQGGEWRDAVFLGLLRQQWTRPG